MAVVARRMTMLALMMTVFALTFSALVAHHVPHHGRGSLHRMDAQALCSQQATGGCTASL